VTRRYPTFTEIFLDLGDKALSRHDEQGKLSLDEPIGPHSGLPGARLTLSKLHSTSRIISTRSGSMEYLGLSDFAQI
jgi:hypothetical protein